VVRGDRIANPFRIIGSALNILFERQIKTEFGGSGITEGCFHWIENNVELGARILEFGAGDVSTPKLGAAYSLTSVEHNPVWIGKFKTRYVYAPLSETLGWYQGDELLQLSSEVFDLALIDGPPGSGNRFGVLLHLDLVADIPIIIVDDTDRPNERLLSILLAQQLRRAVSHHGNFSVVSEK
jgi:hypothetical protein